MGSLWVCVSPADFSCKLDLGRVDMTVVVDRRYRQRDRETRAVLAAPDRLEVLDRLSSSDLVEDGRLLILAIGRDDDANRLAHGFRGGKAEHAFRRPVP